MLPRILLLLLIIFSPLIRAEITAKVDRSTVYQGQKVILTIETDQPGDTRPDLRPLQTDFAVISSRKVNLSSHSTGSVSTKTRWLLQIRPQREGEQVIPSLKVGDQISRELSLSVLPAEQNPNLATSGRSVLIDVSLVKDEILLNAQAMLRAKVYHLKPLPLDANLAPPQSEGLLIKLMGEPAQYTEVIRGQTYTVTETLYAVFPHKEGLLEIEPLVFTMTEPGEKTISLASEPLTLVVRSPAFSNSNGIWLPSPSISLEDNLNELSQVTVGNTIERIFTLTATGLPAAYLPSVYALAGQTAESELVNVILDEQYTDKGIISTRIEEVRIQVNQPGPLQLSAIDLPWWNTVSETGQTATLPQKTINAENSPITPIPITTDNASTAPSNGSDLLIWLLTVISILSTLGCIYSFHKLRTLQKQKDEDEEDALVLEQQLRQKAAAEVTERNTFQALTLACHQNNAEIAQLRLIEWGQAFWNDITLINLEQICERANNQTINFLVLDLEQHLYGNGNDFWQGDLLLEALERIRQRQQNQLLDMHEGDENLSYIS